MKRALLGSLLLHISLLSLLGFGGRVAPPVAPAFSVMLLPAEAPVIQTKAPQVASRPSRQLASPKDGRVAPGVAVPGKPVAPQFSPKKAEATVPDAAATHGGASVRQEGMPATALAVPGPATAGKGEVPLANHGLQIRFRPKPAYPALSRELGEEGVVMLRLTVNAASQLEQVQVLRSSGFVRLDRAAREGVSRWRFEAAMQEGQAVSATLELPVHFKLDEL